MSAGAVLLFPGAGTGADHPGLVAVCSALGPLDARRVDFAYREAGRRAPPRAPKLIDEVVASATGLAAELGLEQRDVLLGGRSMGGRICSMAVADGLPAAGLVLISYPLHPPGKPERLRTEHLSRIDVPCLFVSGTRDPFGTPEELAAATEAIPGEVKHVWIEGARHELRNKDSEVAQAVAGWARAPRRWPADCGPPG